MDLPICIDRLYRLTYIDSEIFAGIATSVKDILRQPTARDFLINLLNEIWHAVIKLNFKQRESVQRYHPDAPTARRTFGKQ